MTWNPKVSICVPAYNQPRLLERLLISIAGQDHKNIEVIISDDSTNDGVKIVAEKFMEQLEIKYYPHQPALKTPRNWNFAIDKAVGDFYMLVHQDDWFHVPYAISKFLSVFRNDQTIDFVFCRNTAITEDGQELILQGIPSLLTTLPQKYNHLIRFNVIGPPSNTMLRKGVDIRYDEEYIWLVDVDYYVRLLKKKYKPEYINEHLVSIGLHQEQTTNFCQANSNIIVKENIIHASKLDPVVFRDIYIFDYYWRFLRNYGIKSESDIHATGVLPERVPAIIKGMLNWQRKLPGKVLRIGPLSKFLMLLNYSTVAKKHYRKS
ncbi:MAG: glycosyltransferase family 2 protein [Chitinophagaceae bacterium]|jgi:glycosyltransferase involved in cell wall biosynthesis|nr:MAG: glycosyltransferase family 2 protein [Chitinophagaceae bacterium]